MTFEPAGSAIGTCGLHFLQTSLTHGRRPLATVRRLGPLRALGALALVPGMVVSALVYPFCLVLVGQHLFRHGLPAAPHFWSNLPTALTLTLFVAGIAALTLPAAVGCLRRGWFDLARSVPMLPVYFLLISYASWLAVIELVHAPNRWNKTEHGLSRTSRSGLLRTGRPG